MALALALALALDLPAAGAEFPTFRTQEIDPHVGNICYAVTTADVDGDGKLDVVAVTEEAVVWFANPSWTKHTLIKGATERDNVCIQPHDIDGDGRVDFALGAHWQPANTQSGGTLQWIRRMGTDDDAPWKVFPIDSEPTLHRIRWGDVLGTGKKQLVVAPLQGRGTKGPDWGVGPGVRILVYSVPDQAQSTPWTVEVADDTLHTTHNLQVTDFDGDGRDDIVIAAWEGVFVLKRESAGRWTRTKLGAGNQESRPNKGASEVQWGHAVWCADLDGDRDEELIIGQRDKSKDPGRTPSGPGVLVYDPKPGPGPLAFTRHVIDDGGVGTEDLVAADLDGDGRNDIVAGGRSTHNVRIYWNRPK